MKKQATQIIPGDSVRVADVNLDLPDRVPTATYAKVIRVERGAYLTYLKIAGIGWGSVRNDRGVRVHARSNRAANFTRPDEKE